MTHGTARSGATGLARSGPPSRVLVAVSGTAVAAWLVAIAAEVSGTGALLHHHALIEGGPLGAPPLWLAAGLALVSWQVMVAGMMLPASLPAIDLFERATRARARPAYELIGFIAAFALAWAGIGLVAFFGDFVLHHVVDATPWLGERRWIIQAGTFALAGAYQLTPFKHHFLAACRHPLVLAPVDRDGLAGVRAGWAHALDCVGASGPLMLLMFAAGFANLAWMALLTGVMVYEARGRGGHRAAVAVGLLLLAASLAAVASGGLPGFEPASA